MMTIEIKIPSVGESVQEAVLAEWFKEDGEFVEKDEPLFVIETDKITLEVEAEADGVLHILLAEGETAAIGAVVGAIEPGAAAAAEPAPPAEKVKAPPVEEAAPAAPAPLEEPLPAEPESPVKRAPMGPAARRLLAEKRLDPGRILGTGPGGGITKGDILLHLEGEAPEIAGAPPPAAPVAEPAEPGERRKPMSPIRKRIAARLLEAKRNTAMLTTFNEIDMSRAMAIRKRYKEPFQKRHGVSLGFMSFFIKACVEALKEIPEINAFVDGDDIIYHDQQNIGVAIGGKRGLVVPVIRNTGVMSFAEIEGAIVDYVAKIKENRLALADLEGGTFTVSNGGVYGSLLSTPILNTPQSGILGMHKIEKRPMVEEDAVVIRPMMYVALSYDHRIVDGKGAVTFLRRVKEFVETPDRILLEV
ncbi:MAG: 2-oxoglutarate dehydrogenase complex dihydrolipoyllysine-residue succinyltransferase [Desulfobacterales bacterium]|nr:2-oxoglutarate dehydrogenase complex dihydrolipoyllysine-residue succinyltransferase [Desulfobacterales bacterium]